MEPSRSSLHICLGIKVINVLHVLLTFEKSSSSSNRLSLLNLGQIRK